MTRFLRLTIAQIVYELNLRKLCEAMVEDADSREGGFGENH